MVPGARSNPRTWVALKKAVERAAIEEAQQEGETCVECYRPIRPAEAMPAKWAHVVDDEYHQGRARGHFAEPAAGPAEVAAPPGVAVLEEVLGATPAPPLPVVGDVDRAEIELRIANVRNWGDDGITSVAAAKRVAEFFIGLYERERAAHRDSEGREGCEVPGCGHAESAHTREGSEGSSACTECRCPVYVLMGEDVTEQFARDSEGTQ